VAVFGHLETTNQGYLERAVPEAPKSDNQGPQTGG
jgi:hypothetical protein